MHPALSACEPAALETLAVCQRRPRHRVHALVRGAAWLASLVFLAWAARMVYLEGYIYEIPKRFSGDFIQTANLAFPEWFDGTNIFYGAVFVLEYRFLFAPGLVEPIDFALANFLLVGVAFVCCWLGVFGWRRPLLAILLFGFWLAYHGTVEALANTSHLELLELAAISLALLLALRQRTTSAGLALGLAMATKTLPGVFLPYLVVTRRWRMLLVASAVFVGFVLLVCWLQGVAPWQGAVALVYQGGNLTKMEFTEYEYTPRADVARILVGDGGSLSPDQAHIAIGVHFALALAAAVLVGLVFARTRATRAHLPLFFGVIGATMLVVAPSAHAAYYVFLLPGFMAGLAEVLSRPPGVRTAILGGALAAGYVFTGFDQPFVVAQRFTGVGGVVPANWLVWHLPTLALLCTFGTLCALYVSAGRHLAVAR